MSATKLRASSPAPIKRITASAISATTSAPRVRRVPRLPLDPRVLSLSIWPTFVFAACRAGTSPKSNPVTMATATLKSRTRLSIATSARRGTPRGPNALTASTAQAASDVPTRAPASESNILSVTSWRTSRCLPAPNAVRTAISVSRVDARTRSRLATLAHAMSSTKPTPPSITSNAGRTLPTIASWSGMAVALKCVLLCGYCSSSRRAICASSVAAPSTIVPAARRPTPLRKCAPRFPGSVSSEVGINGSQISVVRGMSRCGATPITV